MLWWYLWLKNKGYERPGGGVRTALQKAKAASEQYTAIRRPPE